LCSRMESLGRCSVDLFTVLGAGKIFSRFDLTTCFILSKLFLMTGS
jgi:hypothetical protein